MTDHTDKADAGRPRPGSPPPVRAKDPFHEGEAAARARRLRSLAIAGGLVLFVLLIFAVSILRLSSNAQLAAQAAGTATPAPAAATPQAAPARGS